MWKLIGTSQVNARSKKLSGDCWALEELLQRVKWRGDTNHEEGDGDCNDSDNISGDDGNETEQDECKDVLFRVTGLTSYGYIIIANNTTVTATDTLLWGYRYDTTTGTTIMLLLLVMVCYCYHNCHPLTVITVTQLLLRYWSATPNNNNKEIYRGTVTIKMIVILMKIMIIMIRVMITLRKKRLRLL